MTLYEKGGIFHPVIKNKAVVKERKSIYKSVYINGSYSSRPHVSNPTSPSRSQPPKTHNQHHHHHHGRRKRHPKTPLNNSCPPPPPPPSSPPSGLKNTKSFSLSNLSSKRGAYRFGVKLAAQKPEFEILGIPRLSVVDISKEGSEREGDLLGKGPFPM